MSITDILISALSTPWGSFLVLISLPLGLMRLAGIASWAFRLIVNKLSPQVDVSKYGTWAVVTGATDGIGKAYSMEFAKKGMNICLLSRTPDRLSEVSTEIETTHKVQTKCLAVDFSNVSSTLWTDIKRELSALEIGVLVNNVGCSYEHYEFLHLINDETINKLIEINVRATVEMTRIVLQGMLSRKKGVIINIGSGVGTLLPSSPLLAVYAGTKSFVEQFTKSCFLEYKHHGIIFQNQAPLFVATKMSKIRRTSLTAPSPVTWVKGAINEIGNGSLTAGYWVHNLMWNIMSQIPSELLDSYVFTSGKKMRAKALKKKAASNKEE